MLAAGEVLVNLWLALLVPGSVFKGLHRLGVHGRGLDWMDRVVLIVVGVAAAAHMVRLVLDRDERSWAWRQAHWPSPGHRPEAL